MKDPRDVILTPVVSEKSYDLIDKAHTYTFVVNRRSNKSEIRDAVEAIFSVGTGPARRPVRVISVNTVLRRGKRKRTGWVRGRRSDSKRALVTLAPGDSIDIFGV